MPDIRKKTGSRTATQGQYNKPGIYFPNPSDPSDFVLVEQKTVDSKEETIAYGTAHPTAALSTALLCKQDFSANEDNVKSRTRIYRTLPGAATTIQQWDDALKSSVEIETQDIAWGSAAPTAIAEPRLLTHTDSPNESGWITRTITRLAALPSDILDYKTQNFTFPAILIDLTATLAEVGFGNVRVSEDETQWHTGVNSIVSTNSNIRPAISVPTVHKITTSFFQSSALPSDDVLYSIAPNNVRADGHLLRFALGELLNNAISASASAGVYDAQLAGLSESFSWGASAPSASTYLADVAAAGWKIIASDVLPYRGNIYIRQRTEIKLK